MEKYGQYRDKGSGIAPFFPIPPPARTPLLLPWYLFLFCVRVPLVTFAWFVWLTLVQWTPAGGLLRKANLWCVLGIPGVWWIDLQVDGVRRGALSQTPRGRLPGPGTIIASSHTSPLDILYLAAIFDPIFTSSQPSSRLVRPLTLEGALAACFEITPRLPFSPSTTKSGKESTLIPLHTLTKLNKTRVIVVFPEATTSNGRGILKLSPSLLSASPESRIFPMSLRYTPTDIVTPIPGWLEAARFVWRLNSRSTHCIRVRIGAPLTLSAPPTKAAFEASPAAGTRSATAAKSSSASSPSTNKRASPGSRNGNGNGTGMESNFFDTLVQTSSSSPAPKVSGNGESSSADDEGEGDEGMTEREGRLLDAVAETLPRLGRVKRVGLGVEEKRAFVEVWSRRRGMFR